MTRQLNPVYRCWCGGQETWRYRYQRFCRKQGTRLSILFRHACLWHQTSLHPRPAGRFWKNYIQRAGMWRRSFRTRRERRIGRVIFLFFRSFSWHKYVVTFRHIYFLFFHDYLSNYFGTVFKYVCSMVSDENEGAPVYSYLRWQHFAHCSNERRAPAPGRICLFLIPESIQPAPAICHSNGFGGKTGIFLWRPEHWFVRTDIDDGAMHKLHEALFSIFQLHFLWPLPLPKSSSTYLTGSLTQIFYKSKEEDEEKRERENSDGNRVK